ncbi:MAG: hypothetical protein ACXW26_00910 [Allosphingosinicella sp.]
MAAAKHNPSRRALLGAAVALPFVGGGGLRPSLSPDTDSRSGIPDQVRDDGKWDRALATYEAVEAELRAFERRTGGAPWEEQEAVEREMDERLDALGPAMRRLMRMPAPDLRALAKKIELVVDHDVGSIDGGQACLATLKRDAKRLARG